jgi:hypothetical protein
MMSCVVSAAWSRSVSSPCCTKHDQRRGAVLSSHITTIVMSRSGQLGRRCTIKPNCSDIFARLAGASVTYERALESCEPSYVSEAARPFFISMVHSPLGAVAASELSSRGGRARSHRPHGSTRAHIVREARSRFEGHVAAPELTSAQRNGPGPWDTWRR